MLSAIKICLAAGLVLLSIAASRADDEIPKKRAFVIALQQAQDPENVFENWQGMMVGDGSYNIWVRNEGAELNERYLIITINDDE